jgi:glycine hydroxymethyltransferase
MLALDVTAQGRGCAAARALEDAHIICNMNLLPWDPQKAVRDPSGLRLAVHELTRWGMGPAEMAEVGALFGAVLAEGRPAAEVRAEARGLKAAFDALHYCFLPEEA